jgi:energy-coupling factor transport system ATP-binding protein
VDIALAPGESIALIGPNGSGKSTLLKCLVGLVDPTEGDILLDGRPTINKSVAEICQQIAYLPQTPDDLLFAETVHDELVATLENHDIVPEQWRVSPGELLEELSLSPYATAYPRDLSVGQRQRVALGAVMITKPRLLLLDEPTRGLDYAAKQKLTVLWEKWRKEGMGILLVTHDMELAARVANRVIVLSEGQIVDSGLTSDVLGTKTLYGTQMARLFPDSGLLTVHEALDELDTRVKTEK